MGSIQRASFRILVPQCAYQLVEGKRKIYENSANSPKIVKFAEFSENAILQIFRNFTFSGRNPRPSPETMKSLRNIGGSGGHFAPKRIFTENQEVLTFS